MRFKMTGTPPRRNCASMHGNGRRTGHALAAEPAPQPPTNREEFRHSFLAFLRDFLDDVGQPWWAEWVQIAIEDGHFPDPSRPGPPFTLDEVVLDLGQSDQLRPHLLDWANALLDCLRCILDRLDVEPPEADLAMPCRECLRYSRGCRSQDALRLAVRRSVELACRQARFGPLLILGDPDAEDTDSMDPVDIFPSQEA